ncbi:MAG: ArsR/SmtB family transcription factor [Aestuariibacter sp.]
MTPESMDLVFQALGNDKRRKLLDYIKEHPGCLVKDVCKNFDVTRIAVMKHLTVLEKADLLITDKRGRDKHLYINVVPIQMIHARWTTDYSAMWAGRMLDIKVMAEQKQQISEQKSKQK